MLSRVRLFGTPWPVAHQAPLSMEFSRQEYWSGLPFPTPGGLPSSGLEPTSPALAGRFFTTEPPGSPKAPEIQFLEENSSDCSLLKGRALSIIDCNPHSDCLCHAQENSEAPLSPTD